MTNRSGRNQFTAALRFDATAWDARDEETKLYCYVHDNGDCARWTIRMPNGGKVLYSGENNTPQQARAAVRRALARHKLTIKKTA